ncbi:MAG: hypothetical protein WCV67_16290 [Victivallaceae bacterium]|jgi:hypothetical protein
MREGHGVVRASLVDASIRAMREGYGVRASLVDASNVMFNDTPKYRNGLSKMVLV